MLVLVIEWESAQVTAHHFEMKLRSTCGHAEMTRFSSGVPETVAAWHTLGADEVARRVHTEPARGLSPVRCVTYVPGLDLVAHNLPEEVGDRASLELL